MTMKVRAVKVARGGEWGLVSLAVFKTVAAPNRAGWVRFLPPPRGEKGQVRGSRPSSTPRANSALARLLLIVREDRAVLDVRQRPGHVVGVDGRSKPSQRVRQA